MNSTISIRLLETNEDMRLIQILEGEVWGMDPIPTHQTFTASKNGGILIGAFAGGKLIGFSYGFPGFLKGKSYLCSHMLGIHPDYQQMGIGKLLKDKQRTRAQEMGYDLITWTFDPLESRNAYLNVSKLYAICNTYLENCYGEMTDGLNKGLPTDRLQIEWWILSDRVESKWMPKDVTYHLPCELGKSAKGHPIVSVDYSAILENSVGYEIPVPTYFQLIKKNEPELALQWRMKVREVFQALFAMEYAVIGLRKSDEDVQYYQFVKRSSIPLNRRDKGESQ
ncbi:GNAT family N-acetyltransferase [Paenisporosarcina antarctica]|uniref:GNAT family N-acetyltransferase n=1 Tax=Paenisporosarcina antarctica TaxID=417367 RepID=A0A4P7A028_9BACL|nr:GNAT family N-acetyltransferase [Paenisporosarcina antarctica]QBP41924.1 GNAT family N-acetyltransferase [Paenisporosarcina antarctica]